MNAESYIVRIYRRDSRERTQVAGVVEIVADSPRIRAFRNVAELQAILLQGPRSAERRRSAKREEQS